MDTKQFVQKYRIRIESELTDRNPNMDDPKWQAHHYKVVLKRGKRQLTTYFSMGMAHTNEPEAEDVIDCLAMDSSMVENARSFEDWANDLGYDEDSRKAEKTYNICIRQANQLKRFLGDTLYNTLLWDVERL